MNGPIGNWQPSSPVTGAAQASPSAATRQRRPLLRYGAALAAIALLFAGALHFLLGGNDVPPRQVREITIVNITPPPPPPPPPPPQPEQKMIEQPKMAQPEIKEDKPVEKPKDEPAKDAKNDEPPGPLALDAKAVGPGDLFNLAGKPGGNPYGGGGGGGSRFGWYASLVQAQIRNALDANSRTRKAVLQVQIRLWADGTGRVTRVQLVSSTGDSELDSIIRDQVLSGLTLREPPPKDMPMPINTRVTERRPT
jgi:periplasmic protein TonB